MTGESLHAATGTHVPQFCRGIATTGDESVTVITKMAQFNAWTADLIIQARKSEVYIGLPQSNRHYIASVTNKSRCLLTGLNVPEAASHITAVKKS